MGILKGFVKFNGYTVAVSCINYTLTKLLSANAEEKLLGFLPFLKKFSPAEQASSVAYLALFIASITLFLGVFLECKALMIPFIGAYTKVLYDETDGTFRVGVWVLIFSFYALLTLVMLFFLGICTCFRSKDERDKQKQPSWLSQCCWTFWCCRCCRRRGREIYPTTLDAHSHCSCETLNIRTAGPDDKHYHRVIFV